MTYGNEDVAAPLSETLTVAVASLADVIRSKEAVGRDKDLRVLPALRLVHERSEPRASQT